MGLAINTFQHAAIWGGCWHCCCYHLPCDKEASGKVHAVSENLSLLTKKELVEKYDALCISASVRVHHGGIWEATESNENLAGD